MSHVATVQCKIADLDAFEEAVKKKGGVLVRGQREFRYYAGAKDRCVHAVHLASDPTGHEVGLRLAEANTPDVYNLAYDVSYASNVNRAFGPNCEGLQNEYLAIVAESQLQAGGWMVRREVEGQQIHVYGER